MTLAQPSHCPSILPHPSRSEVPTPTMPPDLNSLPPSSTSSTTPTPLPHPRPITTSNAEHHRASPPSPRSPSLSSLQAAAAINAGLQRSPSNGSPARNNGLGLERRRSSLINNLTINDPTLPGPGELQQSSNSNSGSPRSGRRSFAHGTADPHHQRQPSLGEIHQELENEQEAQVNRLLYMIRIQQDQLAQFYRQQQNATSDSPSTSTEQTTLPAAGLPASSAPLNGPHSLSRQSSARLSNADTSSRSDSPGHRRASGSLGPLTEDFLLGGTRDESAFYQAETQMLTRENQMLKQRIRELGT